jgi:hypothetical protein
MAEGNMLNRAGVWITSAVGTMWAAILFASLALVSLPAALLSGDPIVIVAWIAQTFLQLVLLPIIMVGQRLQGERAEKRDQETHDQVMESHAELRALVAEVRDFVDPGAPNPPTRRTSPPASS